MTLSLCGMPFSGKSTLGLRTSQMLRVPFLDTDRLLEERYRLATGLALPCRHIHAKEGETRFRQLEGEVAAMLAASPGERRIVALGGGMLLARETADMVRSLGVIVWLKVPFEVLLERMLRQREPPSYLQGNPAVAFEQLYRERLPHYEAVAHVIIDTADLSEAEVVEALCAIDGALIVRAGERSRKESQMLS